jgi:hypothetical protein
MAANSISFGSDLTVGGKVPNCFQAKAQNVTWIDTSDEIPRACFAL